MDEKSARTAAFSALTLLIKNQPHLLVDKGSVQISQGRALADFCLDFVDTYSQRLIQSKKSAD